MHLLLEEQLEQLHQWFARVYPQWQLEVQTKKTKDGEFYIIIIHHKRHAATETFIKEEHLMDPVARLAMKEGCLERWQRKIMEEIG